MILNVKLKSMNSILTMCSVRVMVLSVDLLAQYTNCRGSNVAGRKEQMKDFIIHSKQFITMEVSAMGQ